MNIQSPFRQNSQLFTQAYNEEFQTWLDLVVFSWRWWIGLVITLACVWIWIRLWKSESFDRLLYVGFFTALLAAGLDLIGIFFRLWDYQYEVIPMFGGYIPWDTFLIPTLAVLFLIYRPHVNPWLKAVIYGAFIAFIGLPLLRWLDLYVPLNWRYVYSFPISVIIYLTAHALSRREKFKPYL